MCVCHRLSCVSSLPHYANDIFRSLAFVLLNVLLLVILAFASWPPTITFPSRSRRGLLFRAQGNSIFGRSAHNHMSLARP